MNEKEFSQKITRTLNWGLTRLEDDKLAKLRAARQQAMSQYREPINVLGLVTVSGQTLNVSSWIRKPLFWLPILAAVVLFASYTFTSDDDIVDVASGERQIYQYFWKYEGAFLRPNGTTQYSHNIRCAPQKAVFSLSASKCAI